MKLPGAFLSNALDRGKKSALVRCATNYSFGRVAPGEPSSRPRRNDHWGAHAGTGDSGGGGVCCLSAVNSTTVNSAAVSGATLHSVTVNSSPGNSAESGFDADLGQTWPRFQILSRPEVQKPVGILAVTQPELQKQARHITHQHPGRANPNPLGLQPFVRDGVRFTGLVVQQRLPLSRAALFPSTPHCCAETSPVVSTPTALVRVYSTGAEEGAAPVSSPLLSSLTGPISADSAEAESVNRRVVQAKMAGIKQGVLKVNLVAALVRGMTVEDALNQLAVTPKRAARTVSKVVTAAKANAIHNHGLDASKLLIAEAFVGKGLFTKRVNPHGRGKSGIKVRQRCQLTVKVREMVEEEITKRQEAKARHSTWRRKLSKLQLAKFAPHRIVQVGSRQENQTEDVR